MSDLDTRLTQAGELWRDELDDGPSLDELFGRVDRNRRRWPLVFAVAAVVALLAVGATLLATRAPAHHHASAPDRTAGPHPTVRPDPTATQRSNSEPAPSSGACSDDFTAQPTRFVDGKAIVWLTYTGTVTCRIDAYGPQSDLTTTTGERRYGYDSSFVGLFPPYLDVRRGDMVTTTVYWNSRCRAGSEKGRELALHFDDFAHPKTAGVAVPVTGSFAPRCDPAHSPNFDSTRADRRTTTDTTTVRVGIRYVGGPAPGINKQLQPGEFTLQYPKHDEQTAVTTVGHSVVVRMPPGTYTLHTVSGSALCLSRTVEVPATGAVSVTVTCSIK